MVIRNNQGLVMASLSQQLHQAYRAEKIEALAGARALQFALEVGVDKAILEDNSQLLMKASTNDGGSLMPSRFLFFYYFFRR